jgi:hypothetical protein
VVDGRVAYREAAAVVAGQQDDDVSDPGVPRDLLDDGAAFAGRFREDDWPQPEPRHEARHHLRRAVRAAVDDEHLIGQGPLIG